MEKKQLYTSLTYAGALPFVAAAAMPWLGIDKIPNVGSFDFVAQTYGLAIICFLAGAHWGTYLYHRDQSPTNLFLTSNVIVLAVWFAFLLNAAAISLFVQVLAFLYLLFVDFRLLQAGLLIDYYFRMRVTVTILVVASLIVTIAAL